MKKYLILLLTLSLICVCKSIPIKNTQTKSDNNDATIYFKATGNEPSWELKIGNDEIVFTSLIKGKEKLVFSPVKPTRAADANIKMYKVKNAVSKATISIQQIDCQNSMSGVISPIKFSLKLKMTQMLILRKSMAAENTLQITDCMISGFWKN